MGEGDDGAGLIELEEWPSEWSEPVDWYMLATERLKERKGAESSPLFSLFIGFSEKVFKSD